MTMTNLVLVDEFFVVQGILAMCSPNFTALIVTHAFLSIHPHSSLILT